MKYICFKNENLTRRFVGFYQKTPSGYCSISWPNEGLGQPVLPTRGKTAEETLFEKLSTTNYPGANPSSFQLIPLVNDFGDFHSRIYRPSFAGRRPMSELNFSEIVVKDMYKDQTNLHYQPYPIDDAVYSKSLNQLGVLKGMLVQLLRTIDPHIANFDTFGSQIRNLIILACTEVESQWKGVLRVNQYALQGRDFTTNDYVKLKSPLRLDEYAVSLPLYPDCPLIEPFRGWDPLRPTKSLDWYDAYNAVKHDRELNFVRAKLGYAIYSVLAVAVLNIAQFGLREFWVEEFGSFFNFRKVPKWKFEELYNFGPKSLLKRKSFTF